ncbi:MAG: winged helix-turn-helix domain-containing protein [Promethearchaeota archaeon]
MRSDIFTVFAHPHRRTLLEDLYYEGEGTIKHFRSDLKLKTGTLYHHLKILIETGLVEQTETKSYVLTETGVLAVRELLEKNQIVEKPASDAVNKVQPQKKGMLQYGNPSLYLPLEKSKQKTALNYKNGFRIFDKSFEITYLNSKKVLVLDLLAMILLCWSLIELQIGISGCFIFYCPNPVLSIVSCLSSLLVLGAFIWIFPYFCSRSEPLSLEFAATIGCLFVPLSSILVLLNLLKASFVFESLKSPFVVLLEFGGQIFWILWIYMIFRRINAMDEKTSLIGSFMINYSFLAFTFFLL